MSNTVESVLTPSKTRASLVRLSESEYRQIVKATIETGKSIPWLLKMAYFKKGISAPTLDAEKQKQALKELSYIGNNIKQIEKAMHTHGFDNIKKELLDGLNDIRLLKLYLGLQYGHR